MIPEGWKQKKAIKKVTTDFVERHLKIGIGSIEATD